MAKGKPESSKKIDNQLSVVRVNKGKDIAKTQDNVVHDPPNADESSLEDTDEILSD